MRRASASSIASTNSISTFSPSRLRAWARPLALDDSRCRRAWITDSTLCGMVCSAEGSLSPTERISSSRTNGIPSARSTMRSSVEPDAPASGQSWRPMSFMESSGRGSRWMTSRAHLPRLLRGFGARGDQEGARRTRWGLREKPEEPAALRVDQVQVLDQQKRRAMKPQHAEGVHQGLRERRLTVRAGGGEQRLQRGLVVFLQGEPVQRELPVTARDVVGEVKQILEQAARGRERRPVLQGIAEEGQDLDVPRRRFGDRRRGEPALADSRFADDGDRTVRVAGPGQGAPQDVQLGQAPDDGKRIAVPPGRSGPSCPAGLRGGTPSSRPNGAPMTARGARA